MNFIEVYDNALTSEQCKLIIDYMNSLKLIPGAVGMDRKVKPETKDSLDLPMNLNQETEVDCIIIDSLFEQRNKYVKKHPFLDTELKLWNVRAGYNLQKYLPGKGFHKNHCENVGGDSVVRVLAWMFYLNTVTDDGGTYFDNYDLTMNAVEGRCVIWPAYWTHMHRGIVSKTESKYIVTGWFNFIDNV